MGMEKIAGVDTPFADAGAKYFKIVRVECDCLAGSTNLVVGGYGAKADGDAGKAPAFTENRIVAAGDQTMAELYAALRAEDVSEDPNKTDFSADTTDVPADKSAD